LAVFAATAIVGTVIYIVTVGLGLAGNAATNAWDGLPPGFRDLLAAVLAVGEALAFAQREPSPGDRIVDARIDLVLDGSIVGPTNRHVSILLGRVFR
jgi:hypothetical protein